jgi:hypothetical protein
MAKTSKIMQALWGLTATKAQEILKAISLSDLSHRKARIDVERWLVPDARTRLENLRFISLILIESSPAEFGGCWRY